DDLGKHLEVSPILREWVRYSSFPLIVTVDRIISIDGDPIALIDIHERFSLFARPFRIEVNPVEKGHFYLMEYQEPIRKIGDDEDCWVLFDRCVGSSRGHSLY
ncbi:hypothetical protein ACFL3M_03435, partial [Patescibacteria group bacterium]